MFKILLLLFLLVPIAEIFVLIEVGSVVGTVPTIGLVVFTAMLGAVLMRAQGFATLQRVQKSLEQGELPAVALLEGAVILVAGALLLTPGFLTDSVGFACLVPVWRRLVIQRLLARQVSRVAHPTDNSPGRVIDGEFTRHDK